METMTDLARQIERVRRYGNGCGCDFCAGKKSWDDNWCARCALTMMRLPKWHENLDVCDECEGDLGVREPPHLVRWADDGGRS